MYQISYIKLNLNTQNSTKSNFNSKISKKARTFRTSDSSPLLKQVVIQATGSDSCVHSTSILTSTADHQLLTSSVDHQLLTSPSASEARQEMET